MKKLGVAFVLNLLMMLYGIVPVTANSSKTSQLIRRMGTAEFSCFDDGWLFARYGLQPTIGDSIPEPTNLQAIDLNDASWRKLSLPHDWAIEGPFRIDLKGQTGKLPYQAIGWYRKHFMLSEKDSGKKIFLDFDGAMAYAEIWLNGKYVGTWPYGYSSFRMDLTPYVHFGKENVVAVKLNTQKWNSRFYSGAGIYRHVWLVKTNPVHVAHWGTFITTPEVSAASATLNMDIKLDNESKMPEEAVVQNQVFELDINNKLKSKVASTEERRVVIEAGKTETLTFQTKISDPKLWDVLSPNRYVAQTTVKVKGVVVDTYNTPFGVRTIRFTHDDGFHLNGRRVQIHGVCMHHDLGALGGAMNTSALRRQLTILKEMGCNAIRTSHNPPAPELLELADQMGILVMDEAFDCWNEGKQKGDYGELFAEWHEKDLAALICRDRNHPCVILWSTGNEVREQYKPELGLARKLTDIVHQYDKTRPATFGASDPSKSAMNGTELQVDVHGMNYAAGPYGGPDFYGKFLNKPGHENLSGYSSESASTVSSRGEYFFGKNRANWQVSSYDLYQPGWASIPDDEFRALTKYPAIAGEFVWTGFDYIGEPTPYNSDKTNLLNFSNDPSKKLELEKKLEELRKNVPPSRSSYFGIVDLAGFPKDRYYLYYSQWCPEIPMAHILPHWNWSERVGQIIPVHVYTSGDEAELFLNGRSLGKKSKVAGKDFRLQWDDVVYQPGELKVIAYKNGKQWATDVVKTTGDAAKLSLSADRGKIATDGADLAYITVKVQDKEGLTVPRTHPLIKFEVEGPGEIVATDNGDATSFVPFQSHEREAFNGLALVIVKAKKGAKGTFKVKAISNGLTAGEVYINTK